MYLHGTECQPFKVDSAVPATAPLALQARLSLREIAQIYCFWNNCCQTGASDHFSSKARLEDQSISKLQAP